MRDDEELYLLLSRWQRIEAERLGMKLPSVMDRKGATK